MFDVSPDEFSYSMALKSCSAGLWSGDSWSHDNGWGAKEEGSASSSPPAQDSSRVGQWDTIRGKEQQHKGPPPSRGEHAIEVSATRGKCSSYHATLAPSYVWFEFVSRRRATTTAQYEAGAFFFFPPLSQPVAA